MRNLIRQLRLAIFVWILGIAIKLIPNDCIDIWKWIVKIPLKNDHPNNG